MYLATIKVLKCDMCGTVGTVRSGVPSDWDVGVWHFCPDCKSCDEARDLIDGARRELEGIKEKIEYVTEFH
ncbi:MAG: hypothetical protein IPN69_08100 [Acidobacteria bacterium]|nr:hypothetical protein [Acidobacteriota bacterium]